MDIILVTRRFTLADGTTAARGTITFKLTAPLEDTAGDLVATTAEIKVPLVDGAIAQPLVATNSPGIQPSGVTYEVTERLVPNWQRTYNVEIPYDASGGTIDLTDLAPVEDAVITYGVTVEEFAAFKGLTTGIHGIADTSQLETQAGAQAKATAAATSAQAAAEAAAATDAQARVDAVGEQIDLPSRVASDAQPVVLEAPTIFMPLGNEMVWLQYTVPACDYAVLRWLHAHTDFLSSAAKNIRCHFDIVINDSVPYRIIDIKGVTTHEIDAIVQPMFVLHEGDTVTAYATNGDATDKVVESAIGVDLYGAQ